MTVETAFFYKLAHKLLQQRGLDGSGGLRAHLLIEHEQQKIQLRKVL